MGTRVVLGRTAITRAKEASKGSIFFLHGTCDSGPGLKNWVGRVLHKEFQFKEYRILYPSSPVRPYHLMDGQDATVWYDRLSPGPGMPEDIVSINQVGEQLSQIIRTEEEAVGSGKVIVGGFSMGGAMALHLGYRFNPNVAGIFALSSFLPGDSRVLSDLAKFVKTKKQQEGSVKVPKLFMSLGTKDPLVRYRWGQSTFDQLRAYGAQGHLYTFPHQAHEITKPQLHVLHNWIQETMNDSPREKITEMKPFHVNDEGTLPVHPDRWPKSR